MIVLWTYEAIQDRLHILTYIASDNIEAAVQLDAALEDAAAKLSTFPRMGRQGKLPGTHEVTVERQYRLIYDISVEAIQIPAVIHTARRWPPFAQMSNWIGALSLLETL